MLFGEVAEPTGKVADKNKSANVHKLRVVLVVKPKRHEQIQNVETTCKLLICAIPALTRLAFLCITLLVFLLSIFAWKVRVSTINPLL